MMVCTLRCPSLVLSNTGIEAEITKKKINNAVVPAEQIEAWILSFAKIKLNTPEQKMKLIDFFVNSIFLYDDKLVVMLNYKGGEKTICFEALNEGIKKANTQKSECSSLFECGEPNLITKEPIYVGCNFGFIVYL